MKKVSPFSGRALLGVVLPVLITLSACGTPPAKDYGGGWTPVNRFRDAPTEIPLSPAYTFYASPMDETLRTMLKRWATDCGLELAYQLSSDFTLYKPVARIRTTDIQAAMSELSSIYAAQGISVTVDGKRILARPSGAPRTEPVAAATKPAAAESFAVQPRGSARPELVADTDVRVSRSISAAVSPATDTHAAIQPSSSSMHTESVANLDERITNPAPTMTNLTTETSAVQPGFADVQQKDQIRRD